MRKGNVFDDEALCDDSEPDESINDGSEGSLADFIVPDINPDESATQVQKRKRGRPPKNAASSSEKCKSARADSDDSNDDEDYIPPTGGKSSVKRPRGRPRKNLDIDNNNNGASSKGKNLKPSNQKTVAAKGPGHPSFPINDFSLTITKTDDDVGRDAFESVAVFIRDHCLKGGVATEVGKRKFQFHLQGIMRMHWPVTLPYLAILQKCIRDLLPSKGTGYKVTCKPFQKGQTFSAMTGYITKDEGNILLLFINFVSRSPR